MAELSPAVAILAAFRERYDETLRPGPFVGRWQGKCLAVALESLADQVVPEGSACMICMPETDVDGNEVGGMLLTTEPNARIRSQILAIAAQLRGGANG